MRIETKIFIVGLLILILSLSGGLHLDAEVTGTVYGKVIDIETKNPIQGVGVWMGTLYMSTKTDKNGDFRFDEVLPGKRYLLFYPPSPYAYDRMENAKYPIIVRGGKNTHVFKELKYGGILEMELFDPGSNSPVDGVYVNIKGGGYGLQMKKTESYSDNTGKFKLGQIAAGKHSVHLRKDGYGMKILSDIGIKAKQTTSLKILFDSTSPAMVNGRVLCQQSVEPLKDVKVIVERMDQYGWSYTYTGADGWYYMFDIEPGNYEITVIGIKEENGKKNEFLINKKTIITKKNPASVNFNVDCTFEYKRKEKK